MNITIELRNEDGKIETMNVRRGYLVKFVDTEKMYLTSYYVKNDGARVSHMGKVKGSDLTENQIAELFWRELL